MFNKTLTNHHREEILSGLVDGHVTPAEAIGHSDTPCGKCGQRLSDWSCLPGPVGLLDSELYHEYCHPEFGSADSPAIAMRNAITVNGG